MGELNLYGVVVKYDDSKNYGILTEEDDGNPHPLTFSAYDPGTLVLDAQGPKSSFVSVVSALGTPDETLKKIGAMRSGMGSSSMDDDQKKEAVRNANAVFDEVLAALDGE